MSWKDVMCLCIVIIGIITFLYGSNYYNGLVGWAGVFVVVAGLIVEIVLSVVESFRKKGGSLETVEF